MWVGVVQWSKTQQQLQSNTEKKMYTKLQFAWIHVAVVVVAFAVFNVYCTVCLCLLLKRIAKPTKGEAKRAENMSKCGRGGNHEEMLRLDLEWVNTGSGLYGGAAADDDMQKQNPVQKGANTKSNSNNNKSLATNDSGHKK